MISQEELNILKLEHSPKNILYITFLGREFVFRNLTIREYRDASKVCSDVKDFEELICKMTCIYPTDYDFTLTGIAHLPSFCADAVISASKIGNIFNIKEMLDAERDALIDPSKQAFLLIKMNFPEITKDVFMDMDWNEICEYVAMSEQLNEMKGINVKLDIKLPEPTEEESKIDINEEVNKLYEQKISPYDYYSVPLVNKYDVVPIPLIGGRHWNDQKQMEEIRKYAKQISKQ